MKYEYLIPEWKELYESGKSYNEIANKYNVSKNTVSRTLAGHIVSRPRSKWNTYANEWYDLYANQAYSKSDIASKYNASPSVVGNILKQKGIASSGYKKFEHLSKEWVKLYKNGKNLTQIAIEYDVSRQTVLNYLNDEGIQARDYEESNRNYKLYPNFFDTLNKEKSYLLGIFFSLGTTFEMHKTWVSQLSIHEDKAHQLLPLLNKLRGDDFEKGFYKNIDDVYIHRFHSKKLFNALRFYGLYEKENKEIKNLKKEFIPTFLAGFLETGSYITKKRNDLFISGFEPLLKSIKKLLSEFIDEKTIHFHLKKDKSQLAIYQNESVNKLKEKILNNNEVIDIKLKLQNDLVS